MPIADEVDHEDRYVTLEKMAVLIEGGGYEPNGTTFLAAEFKMGAQEQFQMGKDEITPTFRYLADLPLSLTEHERLWHPTYGELDVISTVPIPEEQMVMFEATDVYQGAGQ